MTATMTAVAWFTRDGREIETAKVRDIDAAKGTAKYTYREQCHRCGGAGGWKGWPGWTCYRCGGQCWEPWAEATLYTAERLAALKAAEAKRNVAKLAKAQAAQAAAKAEAAERFRVFLDANAALVEGLVKYQEDRFLGSLAAQLQDRGTLTGNQAAAAMAAIAKLDARTAARAASRHIGTIGERIELTLTVEHVIRLDSNLPAYYHAAPSSIYLCRTQDGNRVVYRGSGCFGQKGETLTCKATVTEHGERDGEQQTVINRPKVQEVK